MNFKLAALSAVALFAVPLVASANEGFYVSGAGGVQWQDESNLDTTALVQKSKYKTGWGADAAVGYAWDSGLRMELDLGHLENKLDKIGGVSASGKTKTWTLTANALYEFMPKERFTPFVGIGVGGARVDYSGVRTVAGSRLSDDDNSLALKGIAGVDYKVTDAVSLFADYQYLNIVNLNYTNDAGNKVETDNQHHSIMAGVKYSFGKPPAPPAPAPELAASAPVPEPIPAPAPVPDVVKSRSYIIFFDFDKSVITAEARQILEQVAADFKAGIATKVELTGHADRSGTLPYNQKLSERRASAARSMLKKLGITDGQIATLAKGETQPLVQTPDGVREPQNRRVEIVYTASPVASN